MKGNVTGNGCNDVDKLITGRLGERQRKMERIGAMEKATAREQKRRLSILYTAISIAACVALVVIVNPFAGSDVQQVVEDNRREPVMARPDFSTFRAALPELVQVEAFIDAGEYYKALDLVMVKLKESDKNIKYAEKEPMFDDEEWMYEYRSEKLLNAELRWTYIYLLVMVECDYTAVKELKRYLKDEEFCLHREEAEGMLKALR